MMKVANAVSHATVSRSDEDGSSTDDYHSSSLKVYDVKVLEQKSGGLESLLKKVFDSFSRVASSYFEYQVPLRFHAPLSSKIIFKNKVEDYLKAFAPDNKIKTSSEVVDSVDALTEGYKSDLLDVDEGCYSELAYLAYDPMDASCSALSDPSEFQNDSYLNPMQTGFVVFVMV